MRKAFLTLERNALRFFFATIDRLSCLLNFGIEKARRKDLERSRGSFLMPLFAKNIREVTSEIMMAIVFPWRKEPKPSNKRKKKKCLH